MRKQDAKLHMMYELERFQTELSNEWLDKSLPDDWKGMDGWEPIERHKTRVTVRLDSDMVRWFRSLGPGYGPRMNRILRIYWTALLAGHIKGYPNDNTVPRIMLDARQMLDNLKSDRGGA